MTDVVPRRLTAHETGILERVLSESFDGSAELFAQISQTRALGGIPTLLDLGVPDAGAVSPYPDGVVPVQMFVEGQDGDPAGEILVWVSGGRLSGLELAWFGDESPDVFPAPEELKLGE
jgi:hypothetical protein